MSDYFVPALAATTIRTIAQNMRYVLGFGNVYVPNMCGILEHELLNVVPDYEFAVQEQIILEDGTFAEAQTQFSPPQITFCSEVYYQLVAEKPRARFTAAHELGHMLLHYGARNLNRLPQISRAKYNANSAEWQANTFAASFLAPEHLLRGFSSPEQASEMLFISLEAAKIQMTELKIGNKNRDISEWLKLRKDMGLD